MIHPLVQPIERIVERAFVFPGSDAVALQQQPHEIMQRVLRPIEPENLEASGIGGRPISLRVVAYMQHLIRSKTADFERPFVNPRIGLVRAQLAGKKNMPEIFRER